MVDGLDAWDRSIELPSLRPFADYRELKPANYGKAKRFMYSDELDQYFVKIPIIGGPIESSGFPVFNNGKELYIDTKLRHIGTFASTGSGKTTRLFSFFIHSIVRAKESALIIDPKGEHYKRFAHLFEQAGIPVHVLDQRLPDRGDRFNPLHCPDDDPYRVRHHHKSFFNSVKLHSDSQPYFPQQAAALNSTLADVLAETSPETGATISDIVSLTSIECGDQESRERLVKRFKSSGVSKDLIERLQGILLNNSDSTSKCVCNDAIASLETFSFEPSLADQMSMCDFDIDDFLDGPQAVFLIPSDEDSSLTTILGSIISITYSRLIHILNAHNKEQLDTRLNVVIEEAGSIFVKILPEMLAASRSRNIRVAYCAQSFDQLLNLYGNQAYSILENSRDLFFLGGYDEVLSPMISNLAGLGPNENPLLTVSDLNYLQRGSESIALIDDLPVITSQMFPDYEVYPQDWPACYPKVRDIGQRPSTPVTADLIPEKPLIASQESIDDEDIHGSKHRIYMVGPDTCFLDYRDLRNLFTIRADAKMKRKVENCFSMRHCMAICNVTAHFIRDIPFDTLYNTIKSCFKEM